MTPDLSKKWVDMFDAIFYINMEKSTDRRKHIEKEFEQFKHKLFRVEAVTPEILGDQRIGEIVLKNMFSREPYRVNGTKVSNLNEISLGFSHAEAIRQALEFYSKTGKSKILIIEDDAVISELSYSQTTKLNYVHYLDVPYDIWQLGYTIFDKNAGEWLTEREYSIKTSSLQFGCALVEKGIFGTLGYAINVNEDSIPKFHKFIHELQQGSISDYCLSEQSYLRKIIYDHKLLLPLQQGSTISNEKSYSVVEAGYFLSAFEKGYVKGTNNYNQSQITCFRENFDSRMVYMIVEFIDHKIETTIFFKNYFEESAEEMIENAKELYDEEFNSTSEPSSISRAFVVIFDNLSKPNLGKRHYIKK